MAIWCFFFLWIRRQLDYWTSGVGGYWSPAKRSFQFHSEWRVISGLTFIFGEAFLSLFTVLKSLITQNAPTPRIEQQQQKIPKIFSHSIIEFIRSIKVIRKSYRAWLCSYEILSWPKWWRRRGRRWWTEKIHLATETTMIIFIIGDSVVHCGVSIEPARIRVWRNWKLTDCERHMCVCMSRYTDQVSVCVLSTVNKNWTISWRIFSLLNLFLSVVHSLLKVNNLAIGESCRIPSLCVQCAIFFFFLL